MGLEREIMYGVAKIESRSPFFLIFKMYCSMV